MRAAATDDEIRVATGSYTGFQARGGMTQVVDINKVYISKTATERGGFSGDLTIWGPDAYPTTLDAQREGRVVPIVGACAGPTLESLILTLGDAAGVTTNCPGFGGQPDGCGGGVFVYQAHPIIAHNVVTNNVAGISTGNQSVSGGGLCLSHATGSVITSNLIISNTASTSGSDPCWGGSIGASGSGAAATIQDKRIEGNRINGEGTWKRGESFDWNT